MKFNSGFKGLNEINIHVWSYLTHFFLEWEIFQTTFAQKIKTRFRFSNFFFPRNSCNLWVVEKCGRTGQASDENMAHAHCTLDTWGYKHILRIYTTDCLSTAKMVTRTRLSVKLYIHCFPCSFHPRKPLQTVHESTVAPFCNAVFTVLFRRVVQGGRVRGGGSYHDLAVHDRISKYVPS